VSRRTDPSYPPETGNGHRAISRARKWIGTHSPLGVVRRFVARRCQDDESLVRDAIPAGYERIELTPDGLRAALNDAIQRIRNQRYHANKEAALIALVEVLACAVDVTGDLRTGIVRCGHARLAQAIGAGERSISRYINEVLIPLGIISPVSVGYFDLSRDSDGKGQTAAYVLIQPSPKPQNDETVDKTGDLNRNKYLSLYEGEIFGKTCPDTLPTTDEIIENRCLHLAFRLKQQYRILAKVPDQSLMTLLKPFVTLGDNIADLKHRIEWTQDGQKRRYGHEVTKPFGWLRHRLENWFDSSGQPVATPAQIDVLERQALLALPRCPEHQQPIRPTTPDGYGGCCYCRTDHQVGMHASVRLKSCILCAHKKSTSAQ